MRIGGCGSEPEAGTTWSLRSALQTNPDYTLRGYEAQSGLRVTDQNPENNPMQSSLLVAGMGDPAKTL